jgi:hypothetical protein
MIDVNLHSTQVVAVLLLSVCMIRSACCSPDNVKLVHPRISRAQSVSNEALKKLQ